MKNKAIRKMSAVIMAITLLVTMAFATTSTAYASVNEPITVTVQFYDGENFLLEWPVTINPAEMTDADWNSLYQIPALTDSHTYHPEILMNNERPSAMDATIKALQDMGAADGTEVLWDYGNPVTTSSQILGGYITDIFGSGTVTNTALTTPSLWVGDAWLYEVTDTNGTISPELYATNVALENNMIIKWTYTYGIEEPIL